MKLKDWLGIVVVWAIGALVGIVIGIGIKDNHRKQKEQRATKAKLEKCLSRKCDQ